MLTITDDEFRKLTAFIKTNYGINLKEEKRTLLLGRLQNVLAQKKLGSFSEYYQQLLADSGAEVVTLIDRITTNHTYFMREADHFRYFKSTVLPDLVKTAKDKDLRIWSAGCSSGEEPYTLAMIIYDFLGKEIVWWDAKLLATDISSQMLEIAKAGVYSDEKLAKLPAQWRLNYFKKYDAQNSVLSDKIRNEVIYRKFNLINPNSHAILPMFQ